ESGRDDALLHLAEREQGRRGRHRGVPAPPSAGGARPGGRRSSASPAGDREDRAVDRHGRPGTEDPLRVPGREAEMRASVLVLMLAVFALPPSLGSQEDLRIQELLRKLDDDSIEARASAAAGLIDLGRAALPALKRALVGAGFELRDRLGEVIRKIQDRERLATLLPPPSRITVKAANRPLREVFEIVSKQTSTPIAYSNVPEDARVTVSLDRVPLWKAIDQICRASGKVMADIKGDHVEIQPELFVPLPGKITDLFSVT